MGEDLKLEISMFVIMHRMPGQYINSSYEISMCKAPVYKLLLQVLIKR